MSMSLITEPAAFGIYFSIKQFGMLVVLVYPSCCNLKLLIKIKLQSRKHSGKPHSGCVIQMGKSSITTPGMISFHSSVGGLYHTCFDLKIGGKRPNAKEPYNVDSVDKVDKKGTKKSTKKPLAKSGLNSACQVLNIIFFTRTRVYGKIRKFCGYCG